jgi:hypothetical protein
MGFALPDPYGVSDPAPSDRGGSWAHLKDLVDLVFRLVSHSDGLWAAGTVRLVFCVYRYIDLSPVHRNTSCDKKFWKALDEFWFAL